MDVVGRWTKGLLHLLVGGACAALVAWLCFGFVQTLTHTEGPTRTAMALLVIVALLVVGVLLLAPAVRPAEVALAQALLDVRLTEPVETSSWDSRLRGLAWATAVIVLGGLSLLALLWCVPQGAWLVVAAVDEAASSGLPEGMAQLPAGARALLGLVVAAACVLVQPLLVTLLRSLAPRLLGPTPGDRLVHAERERRRLLEANDLARELHDSIGHALTAIGVQAEAGARLAEQDPAYARESLRQIVGTTHRAVAELDDVLATLRTGLERQSGPGGGGTGPSAERGREPARRRPAAPGAGEHDLAGLLGDLGPHGSGAVTVELGEEVGAEVRRTAYRVLQEALTNARRHGEGDPRGHLRVVEGQVEVLLDNALREAPARPGGGRGLVGMRERLALAGGRLDAGPVAGQRVWRLRATFPAGEGDA